MELEYEIHSYMTATQIDKTLCSQAHPYILSEKFSGPSLVLVAGLCWGREGRKGKGGQRGYLKGRTEGANRCNSYT